MIPTQFAWRLERVGALTAALTNELRIGAMDQGSRDLCRQWSLEIHEHAEWLGAEPGQEPKVNPIAEQVNA